MATQITKDELEGVKKTLDDADLGRASLVELSRAYEICRRANAKKTLVLLGDHIRRIVMKPELNFPRAVIAGLLSGTIVTLTVGRLK